MTVTVDVIDDEQKIIGVAKISERQFEYAKDNKYLTVIQMLDLPKVFDPDLTTENAVFHAVTFQCYYGKNNIIVFKCVAGDLSKLHKNQYTPRS